MKSQNMIFTHSISNILYDEKRICKKWAKYAAFGIFNYAHVCRN